jgi:hypothetical protein
MKGLKGNWLRTTGNSPAERAMLGVGIHSAHPAPTIYYPPPNVRFCLAFSTEMLTCSTFQITKSVHVKKEITMSSQQTYRMTLFKIPRIEDQDKLLEMYRAMPQKALKVRSQMADPLHSFIPLTDSTLLFSKQDGSPYIVSVKAGKTFADQRAQGYTIAVMTTFASKEDFEYYDTACEAHKELKAFAASVHQGNLMVYFHSALE